MAYVYRRPWRRQKQPRPKWVKKAQPVGTAANIIGPFISVGMAVLGRVAHAANVIDPFISNGRAGTGEDATAANVIDPFISNGMAVAYKPNFVPGVIVGANNPALQKIIPSYLYQQYSDDEDLQAFVSAYNTIAQQYLDWLNSVNLPVYTGPLIVGSLLDWVAQGLYGVTRPVLASGDVDVQGPFNTYELDDLEFNERRVNDNRTYTTVSDDIFKRVLTWKLYKGDGKVINIRWLKRRVLRFLLGANGTDVNTADTQQISVTFSFGTGTTITTITDNVDSQRGGYCFNQRAFNTASLNVARIGSTITQVISEKTTGNQININLLSQTPVSIQGAAFNTFLGNSIPFNKYTATVRKFSPLPNVEIFKEAAEQGVLDFPFQFSVVVNIV